MLHLHGHRVLHVYLTQLLIVLVFLFRIHAVLFFINLIRNFCDINTCIRKSLLSVLKNCIEIFYIFCNFKDTSKFFKERGVQRGYS